MRRTLLLHLVRYKRHGRALVPSRSFRVIARAHVETAENRAIRSFRQDPGLCASDGTRRIVKDPLEMRMSSPQYGR